MMATLCHSVRSLRSPLLRSFQLSEVAMRRLQTLPPLWKDLLSGSAPKLPTMMTLLTEPAILKTYQFEALMNVADGFDVALAVAGNPLMLGIGPSRRYHRPVKVALAFHAQRTGKPI